MMAYRNNFAVAIKHNGKILRELEDLIYLPFGSEYSVLLKNKNSRKAVVDIEIDGQDVLDGNSIIVGPNQSTELKGFMKGSTAKNKFRFIKKTKKISAHRGDRIDDSLVRVEYRFETPPPVHNYDQVYYRSPSVQHDWYNTPIASCNLSQSTFSSNVLSKSVDTGITAKGSEINQAFERGNVGDLETSSSVITLQLVGRKPSTAGPYVGKLVKKPLTVRAKLTCDLCGTKSKSSAKFCRECSNYLK